MDQYGNYTKKTSLHDEAKKMVWNDTLQVMKEHGWLHQR
jgi:hypothetical protein